MIVESITGAMPTMTEGQAKELARALYYNLPTELAEKRADALSKMADRYQAHRIINWYMTHAMLSREAVAEYIKEELDIE